MPETSGVISGSSGMVSGTSGVVPGTFDVESETSGVMPETSGVVSGVSGVMPESFVVVSWTACGEVIRVPGSNAVVTLGCSVLRPLVVAINPESALVAKTPECGVVTFIPVTSWSSRALVTSVLVAVEALVVRPVTLARSVVDPATELNGDSVVKSVVLSPATSVVKSSPACTVAAAEGSVALCLVEMIVVGSVCACVVLRCTPLTGLFEVLMEVSVVFSSFVSGVEAVIS